MKTSHSEQQQALGRHFDAIREMQADSAREIAARAPSFIRILTHPETGVALRAPAGRSAEVDVADGAHVPQ